jgi:sugar phosphate isomerase/epimerase
MIKSAVTVSLVAQARGGPFVFWDDLPAACARASELGFDAIEIFAPNAQAVPDEVLRPLLERHQLKLAAVGTGGGWVVHKWTLTHVDPEVRAKARQFIREIIDWGARFGAPAILGSMQGRFEGGVSREQAVAWLTEALNDLGEHAQQRGVPFLYEFLNRYETNLFNRVADSVDLLRTLQTGNVKLLADLFHMNIEEVSIAGALQRGGSHIGHVHFVDSNRRAAGCGHTDFGPVAEALKRIGFDGYVSAEAFAWPDSEKAALATIESFKAHFR